MIYVCPLYGFSLYLMTFDLVRQWKVNQGQWVTSRQYFINDAGLFKTQIRSHMTFQFILWPLTWLRTPLVKLSHELADIMTIYANQRTKGIDLDQCPVLNNSMHTWFHLWSTFHMNWHKIITRYKDWVGDFVQCLNWPNSTFAHNSCEANNYQIWLSWSNIENIQTDTNLA